MTEILIPLIVFSTPVLLFFTSRYFRLREKQLEAGSSPKLLQGLREEYETKQRALEARIENLESIVIELDSQPGRKLLASAEAKRSALQNEVARPLLSDGGKTGTSE